MHSARRRILLRAATAWLAARPCLAVADAPARAPAGTIRTGPPRELWITRPQAQESVRAVYWADGAVQPEGYRIINHLYRDLHAGVARPIAIGLLDLNHAMQAVLGHRGRARPLILLSGFRTPDTNRLVGGVDPSAHESGEADDFIFEGLSLEENFRLARSCQVGGLGVYPDRGSLHKDLGALRTWVQFGPAVPGPIRINPERHLIGRSS